jgi:alkylation response protein AidB-like acyl-CoA dehydrogenase
MFLEYTPEQQALRKGCVSARAALTPDVRAELGEPGEGSPVPDVVRQIGTDGWLGIGWPQEYGSGDRRPTSSSSSTRCSGRGRRPVRHAQHVGPTIMRSAATSEVVLPAWILAGEINSPSATRSQAGTDLASLRTRAVLDGDEWVINGNKVFTSGANQADYVWLACRTDADAPKHKGISIIVVPTASAGFKCTPIVTVGGNTTTATYYDDVRAPKGNVVGDVNAGWQLITTQLNHELGPRRHGGLAHRLGTRSPTGATTAAGGKGKKKKKMIDVPWVQMDLARAHARLEAMKLLNWRMAAALDAGALKPADSSSVKVYGTETLVDVYRTLLGVLGAAGYLPAGSPGAVLHGDVERAGRAAQINTFGGGVNEVQREIIASAGLGMARRAR